MKITLLDPETAAAIRADNDRYIAKLRGILERAGAQSIEGVGYDVRHRAGEIIFRDEAEACECAHMLTLAGLTSVSIEHMDWSDDPDFEHDHEWIVDFKVD
jgi:hypothetical protein